MWSLCFHNKCKCIPTCKGANLFTAFFEIINELMSKNSSTSIDDDKDNKCNEGIKLDEPEK